MKLVNEAKKYLPVTLLLVLLLSGCSSQTATTNQQPAPVSVPTNITPATNPGTPEKPSGLTDRVDVVYFYRGTPPPCHCMQVIGDNIKLAVQNNFKDELSSGKLTFQMLASDESKNAAMVKKYNTPPFCLFISTVNGKTESIKAIEEIWDLSGDEKKFSDFVKSAVEKSLKGQA